MVFHLFRTPTPAEMLKKQLADAKENRIKNEANAEYANAMVNMLNARIARIERELQAMTPNQEKK